MRHLLLWYSQNLHKLSVFKSNGIEETRILTYIHLFVLLAKLIFFHTSYYKSYFFYLHSEICALILERGEGRERDGQKHQCGRNINWLSSTQTWTGDWTCKLGMCSDWKANLWFMGQCSNQLSCSGQGNPIFWLCTMMLCVCVHTHTYWYTQGGPPKQILFIKKYVFIFTCLNFSQLQSTLHLMQYTYCFFHCSELFLNSQFWCLLVLLPFFVSPLPHWQNASLWGYFHPGKQQQKKVMGWDWVNGGGVLGSCGFWSKTAKHSAWCGQVHL